jgi:hypothetical protein
MAEATLSVCEAELRASMISGVYVLAHEHARDVVKRQLRDRGLKVGAFSRRQITLLADEYFATRVAASFRSSGCCASNQNHEKGIGDGGRLPQRGPSGPFLLTELHRRPEPEYH